MDELKTTLQQILEKMKKFLSLYEQNEAAVREQLVAPMLRILGWNPEDPEEVRPNERVEEGYPDYSLYKNGEIALVMEVKNLGEDIQDEKNLRQLGRYCFARGAKYGVLTNGGMWILIRSFEEGTSLSERIVWKVDLENEEISAIVRKITAISKANIDNVEHLVKKLKIVDEVWQSLLDVPEQIVKGLLPTFKSIIAQGYPDYHFEDQELEDFIGERLKEMLSDRRDEESPTEATESIALSGGAPRKMRIENKVYELHYSYEILVHTVNWLIEKKKLKASDYPVIIGRGRRYLINKEPKHRDGEGFRAPKQLSNGLWIETHYSTAACITYAKRLLQRFGYSAEILVIE